MPISSFPYAGTSSGSNCTDYAGLVGKDCLPLEGQFDVERFLRALESYMQYSGKGKPEAEQKGRFAEKERLFTRLTQLGNQLKDSDVDHRETHMKTLVDKLEQGADQLTSRVLGLPNVGSGLLGYWHRALKTLFQHEFSTAQSASGSGYYPGARRFGI